jgi:hypothetical protein
MKIEDIRKISNPEARTAAAEELRAYAAARADEARLVRDQGVRDLRAAGTGPAAIVRGTRVSAHTVKVLVRGVVPSKA